MEPGCDGMWFGCTSLCYAEQKIGEYFQEGTSIQVSKSENQVGRVQSRFWTGIIVRSGPRHESRGCNVLSPLPGTGEASRKLRVQVILLGALGPPIHSRRK